MLVWTLDQNQQLDFLNLRINFKVGRLHQIFALTSPSVGKFDLKIEDISEENLLFGEVPQVHTNYAMIMNLS